MSKKMLYWKFPVRHFLFKPRFPFLNGDEISIG
jgi:hypothetical protein